ncbi:alpha-methylacyl-CoA racemase [Rhodoligotrophos appendicifer]|uniref:CaiB/BaiF CoA transferase family protein n=1 Tax=Rhodoligotrophos appendicifer TaxID=987056 RepID=UPI0014793D7F|nr:CaiB/BaiF CoA-transferase family protein [Rhodoligotrophos appendicifer]
MSGPLVGLRGIEFAGIGPAPLAAMFLSDLGADILRIDAPFSREPSVTIDRAADVTTRGRPAIVLNLKCEQDRNRLLDLCVHVDFLIEGFRPGVMERLGLGPDVFDRVNPRLIYGRMTGWGQTGPLSQRAGHDINYISVGGALHPLGPADHVPPPPLNLVGDNGGGGLLLAFGILAACMERQRSGRGQVVDAAIVDGTAALMAPFFGMLATGKWSLDRESNIIDGAAPWYRAYRTSDNRFIAIGPIETKFYRKLIELLELEEDALPDQFDRSRWPELTSLLERTFATRTRDDWCRILEQDDTCFSPVLDIGEMIEHPHIAARRTIVVKNGLAQPAPAPRFSRTPAELAEADLAPDASVERLLERWSSSDVQ